MTEVEAGAIGDIALLCRRSIWSSPNEDELARALYPADQDTVVLGDPNTGVVAAVRVGSAGFVRLVVVAPDLRRIGRGRKLLAAAEEWLAGTETVTLCADPEYSLWSGVPATDMALTCLAESAGFSRAGTSVTMEFDLKSPLPPDPEGWEVAEVEHDGATERLCKMIAPESAHAALRALERGTLVIVRDGDEIAALCAFDVNRGGVLGPVVAGPDKVDAQRTAILGALRQMREWRHARAEISDVDSVRRFAELGGKVARVSFVYSKNVGSGAGSG